MLPDAFISPGLSGISKSIVPNQGIGTVLSTNGVVIAQVGTDICGGSIAVIRASGGGGRSSSAGAMGRGSRRWGSFDRLSGFRRSGRDFVDSG